MSNSRTDPREAKSSGVVYTPPYMARYIVSKTLLGDNAQADAEHPTRIVDPACGEGVLLAQAYALLAEREQRKRRLQGQQAMGFADLARLLRTCIFGLEIDEAAARRARQELVGLAVSAGRATSSQARRLAGQFAANICVGNALIDFDIWENTQGLALGEISRLRPFSWRESFPQIFERAPAGFDAVVGNPPYLNIRRITQQHGELVKSYLRQRYKCATRGYDLYVLFLERAYQILRPGGHCGMIVPNKIAGLQYAAACREMLASRTTIQHVADVASLRVFPGAGVYPYVIAWQKNEPPSNHQVTIARVASRAALDSGVGERRIAQRDLFTACGICLHGQLNVESRGATLPLGSLADLHSGTTGFAAQRMAGCLREKHEQYGEEHLDFIVSGNIDRYSISRGDVRFMKRRFLQPVLPLSSLDISAGKWSLYRSPKIVVAGLSRRLEAAFDRQGMALGVQVYAATNLQLDHRYLLALLNSKLMTYLFRMRYRAKRLSGEYLAVNKGQLQELPIRAPERSEGGLAGIFQQIAKIAGDLMECGFDRRSPGRRVEQLENELDGCVYTLYGLTDAEVRAVESSFAAERS